MECLTFERSVHTALWGSESWEISAHASDPSRIASGAAAGRTLRDLFPSFPLLFKVIRAERRLSVQVHPNEATSRLTGGEPKTEMWCALSAGTVYAGLRPGTDASAVEAAVASGRFEDLLVRYDVVPGDVLFIPGGTVHAIGDDVCLYEVQQSSNTTYRLYDWGRVGADGKPRELHVAKALQAIDYGLPEPVLQREVECPLFNFEQVDLDGEMRLATGSGEFLALFVVRGEAVLDGRPVAPETSVLLPPGAACVLGGNAAHVLLTRFRSPDASRKGQS